MTPRDLVPLLPYLPLLLYLVPAGGLQNATLTMVTPQTTLRLSNRPSRSLRLWYRATYPASACCPGLQVYTEDLPTNTTLQSRDDCFPDIESFLETNWYFSMLNPMTDDHVECVVEGNDTICEGTKELIHTTERYWYVRLGYECRTYRSLETNSTILFEYTVHTDTVGHCESFRGKSHFHHSLIESGLPPRLYTPDRQVYLPSVLGLPKVTNFATRQIDAFKIDRCHQHLKPFLHLTLYPACNVTRGGTGQGAPSPVHVRLGSNTSAKLQPLFIAPCRELCLEVYSACSSVAKLLQGDGCNNYPTKECYYSPVRCPAPPVVECAIPYVVNSTHVTYKCVNETALHGECTLHCLPSGHWSKVNFSCKVEVVVDYSFQHSTLIAAYVTIVVFLALIGVVLCYNRKLLMFLLQVHVCRDGSSLQEAITAGGSDKPKVFLSYSSLDRERVEILKSELNSHFTECQVLSYEEDFIIGQRIIDCIREAVWHSQAAILFLTQNYLDSEWCEFEFHEAHLRHMRDRGFRVVVVVDGEVSDLKGMPEELQLYLKSHIYLNRQDAHFWYRLRNTLLS